MNEKLLGAMVLLIMAGILSLLYVVVPRPDYVVLDGPIEVLSKPYPLGAPKVEDNKVLGVLNSGDTFNVTQKIFGKDYAFYKIEYNGEGLSRRIR
ncbi:MAG: hypothetical protein GY933_17600 [Hyphomicrobiales bacterium]|nr:hypothetical protein [Hyphomicrobiales bacterium]